jgi:hypothetical protein
MGYCADIFGKDIDQLVLDDLISFFKEGQEESRILEFKSGKGLGVEGVCQEISAFLNTEGGLLILGTPKEEKIGKIGFAKGKLVATNFKDKDWLVQKIAAGVSNLPGGLLLKEFDCPPGKVYVIEVSQSLTPPHQACHNGVYYMRLECESRFIPHGLLEALFNRRKQANLNGQILIQGIDNSFRVTVKIINQSDYPAEKVSMDIQVFGAQTVLYNKEFKLKREKTEDVGMIYHINESVNDVLVKGINASIEIELQDVIQYVLIRASYWGRETSLKHSFLVLDTFNKEVVQYDTEIMDLHKNKEYLRAMDEVGFAYAAKN